MPTTAKAQINHAVFDWGVPGACSLMSGVGSLTFNGAKIHMEKADNNIHPVR